MKYKLYLVILLLCVSPLSWADPDATALKKVDLTELDMADLLKMQVTSVSKKAQTLSDAAAAVFVISNEDIKRSGVTSVPEALRMAPGVDVARINSNKWAVTARGFNGGFANKLLVLIDGRSVYTPTFSGVYWDAQDVMLEDIDRIEVIRGSGATLWGANAVNGVINIITKSAENTQGGLLAAGTGSIEKGFGGLRYGTKLAENSYGRAYVKAFQRDEFHGQDGNSANDEWNKLQGGFRVDSLLSSQDKLTVQGDIYQNHANQTLLNTTLLAPFMERINDKVKMNGWNITSKLKHSFSTTAEYSLQFYYDHYSRNELIASQARDTLDVDFQNNFALTANHNVIWGLGYRYTGDKFSPTPLMTINPLRRGTQLVSGFIQDEIMLIDGELWFTLGSKFEHNDYTGFEGQPTAKLMWAPDSKQRLWASFSRSVRTPSRAESDITLLEGVFPVVLPYATIPIAYTVNGNRQYKAEQQLSFELGYRFSLAKQLSLDLTAFYNNYKSLRTASTGTISMSGTSGTLPNYFTNNGRATTYGFEASAVWQMQDWWRWDANYSFLNTRIAQNANDQVITSVSPSQMLSLRAAISPLDTVNVDFWLRYNSKAKAASARSLFAVPVNEYVTLDTRLSWKIHPALELSVTGQNLLNNHHLEYIEETHILPTEIPRGVYGKMVWGF